MGTYPSISFNELKKRVSALGFEAVRQKGSHIRFVHPDGRKTVVPDHGSRDVPRRFRGLLGVFRVPLYRLPQFPVYRTYAHIWPITGDSSTGVIWYGGENTLSGSEKPFLE